MTNEGLPIDDRDGGITWISSISSKRRKNLVLCPNKLPENPTILVDR
jgi:hypothetical protein